MTHAVDYFRHCPACGSALPPASRARAIECTSCGFLYYLSNTVATGLLLSRPDGALLFVRRAKEPAKGLLALPGGFVEVGETAEEGLRREVAEEVGLNIGFLQYLCSAPNSYEYQGIVYPVLDLFFTAVLEPSARPQPLEDVAEICWMKPDRVRPSEIAFPSLRAAVQEYLRVVSGLE